MMKTGHITPAALVLLIIVLGSVKLPAQDMHFGHFFNTPLITNPGQTGQFDGKWRLTGDYRHQWKSITVPFTTFAASVDYQIDMYDLPVDLHAGLYLLRDQAGDGDLTTQKIYFSGAASRQFLDDRLQLAVGVGYGNVQQSVDFSKFTFDAQWTNHGFDDNLPTQEHEDEQQQSYQDLNLGAYGSYRWSEEITLRGGFAMMHVNRPQSTFYSSQNKLGIRPLAHAGATWQLRDEWTLEPSFMFMQQKKANEFLAGANVHYEFERNGIERLTAGAWFRGVGDAIPAVGLTYKGVAGLISYDFNLYDVNEASKTLGGFEISLVYIIPAKESVQQLVIPCIRI